MVDLGLKTDKLTFINIGKDDLQTVLEWYNRVEDYMFGTGIDKPMTMRELAAKYIETAVSSCDFYVWISTSDNEKVGIIKGSIKCQEKNSIWINSLIIDPLHRKKGYGRSAVDAMVSHVSRYRKVTKIFVSVVEDNTDGMLFWKSIGFSEVKRIENHISLAGRLRGAVIMSKSL